MESRVVREEASSRLTPRSTPPSFQTAAPLPLPTRHTPLPVTRFRPARPQVAPFPSPFLTAENGGRSFSAPGPITTNYMSGWPVWATEW